MLSFKQYLLESSSNHVFRIDTSPIKIFHPQPYAMDAHGNSSRGEDVIEGHKGFNGVYAAQHIGLIAPYALQKNGKTNRVPWIAVHRPGQTPMLFVHHDDISQKHSPIILSKFHGGDFSPRHEVVRTLHGENARDTGDDEHIALKSVTPLSQTKITDIPSFLEQHMDVRVIPPIRSGGGRDEGKMRRLGLSLSKLGGDISVIRNGQG